MAITINKFKEFEKTNEKEEIEHSKNLLNRAAKNLKFDHIEKPKYGKVDLL